MANNSTVPSPCPYKQWYNQIGSQVFFVTYYVASPPFFFVGLFGHGLCLFAFLKQVKKEKAYVYQIFFTISEILEVLLCGLYVMAFQWWSSPLFPGPDWFRSCYWCMLVSALVVQPAYNMLITSTELFSLSISADRFFALWKPFVYRSTNFRRIQILVGVVVAFLGVSTSVFHAFRFTVVKVAGGGNSTVLYQLKANDKFAASPLGSALNNLRNLIQGLALVALCVCNAAVVVLFVRQGRTKIVQDASGRRKSRQEAERTLALMAAVQSIFIAVSMTYRMVYFTWVFIDPNFYPCKGPIYAPMLVASKEAMDILFLVSIIFVSKRIRAMIFRMLPCAKCGNATSVIDIAGGGTTTKAER